MLRMETADWRNPWGRGGDVLHHPHVEIPVSGHPLRPQEAGFDPQAPTDRRSFSGTYGDGPNFLPQPVLNIAGSVERKEWRTHGIDYGAVGRMQSIFMKLAFEHFSTSLDTRFHLTEKKDRALQTLLSQKDTIRCTPSVWRQTEQSSNIVSRRFDVPLRT